MRLVPSPWSEGTELELLRQQKWVTARVKRNHNGMITLSYLDESFGTHAEVELPSGHPHMRLPGTPSQEMHRTPSNKGPIPVLVETALALAEAMNGREQQSLGGRQQEWSSVHSAGGCNSSGVSGDFGGSRRAIPVAVESVPPSQAAIPVEVDSIPAVELRDFSHMPKDDHPVMIVCASDVASQERGWFVPKATTRLPTTGTLRSSSDADWHCKDGDWVEIWSGPRGTWLTGKAVRVRNGGAEAAAGAVGTRLVTVAYKDASGLQVYEEVGPERLRRPVRTVCADGTRCRLRRASHMMQHVHPFESDYLDTCERSGVTPVQPSLRRLFEWVDADGSGRISRWELEAAVPLLSRILGEHFTVSEDAWMRLGEDQSGTVNFNEFAQWAGPRLGLPLDGEVSREASESSLTTVPCAGLESSLLEEHCCCGILGCPCDQFRPVRGDSDCPTATCMCGHKRSAHTLLPDDAELHQIERLLDPSHWGSSPSVDMPAQMVRLGLETLNSFQVLFHKTYHNTWTRGRKNDRVPRGYRARRAFRCENPQSWRRYQARREQLLATVNQDGGALELYEDVLCNDAWRALADYDCEHVLSHQCNEWYLFFGASPKIAESICNKGFKRGASIGNGSMYGKGAYFAESITRADENAKPNEAGECAVIFCRVLGGRVLYTDAVDPDPESLVSSCIDGPYDCVLGDREKSKGTFREFVFFDADRILPEFVVHYTRDMPTSSDDEEAQPEGSSECVVA